MENKNESFEKILYEDRNLYVYSNIGNKDNLQMFLVQDGQMFQELENNIIKRFSSNLEDLLVVFIESKNRLREYSPWFSRSLLDDIGYFEGGGDEYLEFILKRVKPFIQRRYNIRIDGSNTFLCGASLGGLISTYGMLEYNRELGGGVFVSPSYWYEGFLDYVGRSQLDFSRFKIYLDVGDVEGRGKITQNKDMAEVVIEMKHIFLDKGICQEKFEFVLQEGMGHNDSFFIDRIYRGIETLKNM